MLPVISCQLAVSPLGHKKFCRVHALPYQTTNPTLTVLSEHLGLPSPNSLPMTGLELYWKLCDSLHNKRGSERRPARVLSVPSRSCRQLSSLLATGSQMRLLKGSKVCSSCFVLFSLYILDSRSLVQECNDKRV